MNRTSIKIAFAIVLVLALARFGIAGEIVPGLPPFGSFSGGPLDIVDNANLNVHFAFPILNKAGRGLSFNYAVGYDSWVWRPDPNWTRDSHWGWSGITQWLLGKVIYAQTQGSCTVNGTTYYYNVYSQWEYKQATNPGSKVSYSFTISDASVTAPQCTSAPPYSATATANDGSGVTISATAQPSATISFRSGNTLNPPLNSPNANGTLTDTNGNQITATVSSNTVLTDTLGSTVTASGTGSASSPFVFTYTSAAGTSVTAQMNFTTYTVQTNFGCSGISQYGPTSADLPSSIRLPDGTSYSFTYEVTPGDTHSPHYVTARIASVTLPTGGQISYSYTGGNNGVICADGTAAGLNRTTPDGTWSYTRSGSGSAWTTTMADPQGNQTVMQFQGIYETERQVYQGSSGSGTLLDTVYTCYNGAAYPCNSTVISLPITQLTKTNSWASGQTSQTVASYNTYGLPTELDEYDYGHGSPGSLVRKTVTSYASLGNNINNRPASVSVYAAGTSNPTSQTSYTYDQGSGTATSGTPHEPPHTNEFPGRWLEINNLHRGQPARHLQEHNIHYALQ